MINESFLFPWNLTLYFSELFKLSSIRVLTQPLMSKKSAPQKETKCLKEKLVDGFVKYMGSLSLFAHSLSRILRKF